MRGKIAAVIVGGLLLSACEGEPAFRSGEIVKAKLDGR